MDLMPCPQAGCDNKISPKAQMCPSCGIDLPRWYSENLEPYMIGAPKGPLIYWWSWHFWYALGCGLSDLEMPRSGWINAGDIIYKHGPLKAPSPVSGLLIEEHSAFYYSSERPDIDINWVFPNSEFLMIRPRKGSSPRPAADVYRNMIETIVAYEKGGFIRQMLKMRSNLDPKRKFESQDELIAAAYKMRDIKFPVFSLDGKFQRLLS
ncbi:MAG: hypothetical protein R3C58_10320 [Parvularculaceae bacterium]